MKREFASDRISFLSRLKDTFNYIIYFKTNAAYVILYIIIILYFPIALFLLYFIFFTSHSLLKIIHSEFDLIFMSIRSRCIRERKRGICEKIQSVCTLLCRVAVKPFSATSRILRRVFDTKVKHFHEFPIINFPRRSTAAGWRIR